MMAILRTEKRFNLEEMCFHVAIKIHALGGKIKKTTVQGFYKKNVRKRDGVGIFERSPKSRDGRS